MPKTGVSEEDKAAVAVLLDRWKAELRTQELVAERVGFSQQVVSNAMKHGVIGHDFAAAVFAEEGRRLRQSSVSIAQLPPWIDLARLPQGLRDALEHDSIHEKHRGQIPKLLDARYIRHSDEPESWWVTEAEKLHNDERRHGVEPPKDPPPTKPTPAAYLAGKAEQVRAAFPKPKRRSS